MPTTVKTILVVEDEVLVRMDICETLRAHGYSILEASNADEALQMLARGTMIDLIFTDIRMPGKFDGLDLARAAAARNVPVLIASGHLHLYEVPVELRPLLAKPYSHADVLGQIRDKLAASLH